MAGKAPKFTKEQLEYLATLREDIEEDTPEPEEEGEEEIVVVRGKAAKGFMDWLAGSEKDAKDTKDDTPEEDDTEEKPEKEDRKPRDSNRYFR